MQHQSKPNTVLSIAIIFCIFFSFCKNKTTSEVITANQSETELSETEINQMIISNPRQDSLYYRRAQFMITRESYDSAIADLQKAISFNSKGRPVYYQLLSDALLMNLESRDALNIIEEALEYFPDDEQTILKSAKIKLILKQHLAALTTLDKILSKDPENVPALYLAGHIFYEMGDKGRAVNSFQKAVDLNPEFREGWIMMGDVLTELKNDKAILYYDNAIHLDSSDVKTWHNKAYALSILGKKEESMNLFKQISIKFPDYEPAFFNLGMLYKERDSIPEAIEYFSKSIQLNSSEPTSYYQRGLCYLKTGDKVKAKADFTTAAALEPTFEEALNELKKL
jgi:tetratricopeptide (TPR) repeat protein